MAGLSPQGVGQTNVANWRHAGSYIPRPVRRPLAGRSRQSGVVQVLDAGGILRSGWRKEPTLSWDHSQMNSKVPILHRCIAFVAALVTYSVVAQGTFTAKNNTAPPILDESGKPLSRAVGAVELFWGSTQIPNTNYTNSTALIKDGVFVFGLVQVSDRAIGNWIQITIRAWDSSVGATYSDAVAAGHGYGSTTCAVSIVPFHSSLPPDDLGHTFPGLQLVSPLPRLGFSVVRNRRALSVQAEAGRHHLVLVAAAPNGPWGYFAEAIGAGRDSPVLIPIEPSVNALFFRIAPQ